MQNDELTTRLVRLPNVPRHEPAFLIVLVPGHDDERNPPGTCFTLQGFNKLGRLMTNDIVLADHSVSREHCVIERRHDGYHLVDEASANGTVVSGKKVRDVQLSRFELLQVGAYRLLFWQGDIDDPELARVLHDRGVKGWKVRAL
jgi:hypothetical protein